MDSGRIAIKMLWTMFKEDQRPVIRASARVTREEFLSSEYFAAAALVKSDISADKTFLFACSKGVEETHHNFSGGMESTSWRVCITGGRKSERRGSFARTSRTHHTETFSFSAASHSMLIAPREWDSEF